MGTFHISDEHTVLDLNVGLGAALTAALPLIPQIDLLLYGSLGLGPLALDFQARLDAALSVTIIRPDVWVTGQLKAMADLMAGISAGVVLPGIVANLDVGVAADLQAKLLGINALIDATLAIKLPAANVLASLEADANLQVGYFVWEGTGSDVKSGQIESEIYKLAEFPEASAPVYVVGLVVTAAADFNTLGTFFLTS